MSDPSRQQVMDPAAIPPVPGGASPRSQRLPAARGRVPPRLENGFPLVLTADRTLFAAYDLLLEGMIAAS